MQSSADPVSPPALRSHYHAPYNPSIGSSASSSAVSLWSDAVSQTSEDSSLSAHVSDDATDPSRAAQPCRRKTSSQCVQNPASVSAELRQHPRRTASSTTCPPALMRQCDRKINFVDNLVDNAAAIVEAIWPLSSVPCRTESTGRGVLPLRTFLQETLRRSRTSYSTLQVALYYLILIKPYVPAHDFTMEQPQDVHTLRALQCGRRMFLAALILASKYLQDRNYSARAWSKISGLHASEINQNEMAFLRAVDWKLHIADRVFQRWTDLVLAYTPQQPPSPGVASALAPEQAAEWRSVIQRLTPELDTVVVPAPSPRTKQAGDQLLNQFPTPCLGGDTPTASAETTPVPPRRYTPAILEPSPMACSTASAYATAKAAPALGLLQTPRLTPQASTAFGTPSAGSVVHLRAQRPAMASALALSAPLAQYRHERWQLPVAMTSSPMAMSSFSRCASSLAISHSASSPGESPTATSSPDSMVSDHGSTSSGAHSDADVYSRTSSIFLAPMTIGKLPSTCTPPAASALGAGLGMAKCVGRPLISAAKTWCDGPFHAGKMSNPITRYPDFTSSPDAYATTPTPSSQLTTGAAATRPARQTSGSKRGRASSINQSPCDRGIHHEVRSLLWDVSPVKSDRSKETESPRKRVKSSTTSTGLFGDQDGIAHVGLGLRLHGAVHPSLMGSSGPGKWAGVLH